VGEGVHANLQLAQPGLAVLDDRVGIVLGGTWPGSPEAISRGRRGNLLVLFAKKIPDRQRRFLLNNLAFVVFFKKDMSEVKPNFMPLRVVPTESELEHGDDEQLMALAAGGHKAAFAVLVQRHLPRVTKFCARFAGQLSVAEELAQEIFLEVWLRRDRYRSQGKFLVFLFTMARHRCLNRVRDEGRRDRREQTVAEHDGLEVPSQLDALLDRERQRQVQAALSGLSVKLREALLLRFDQGLDYADVARILGDGVRQRTQVFRIREQGRRDLHTLIQRRAPFLRPASRRRPRGSRRSPSPT